MSIREKLEQNRKYALGMAVGLFVVAMGALYFNHSHSMVDSTPPPQSIFGYDLGTNQVFVLDEGPVPPFAAPSGANAGVAAAVYSCGDCRDSGQWVVGYLQKFTPDSIQQAGVTTLRARDYGQLSPTLKKGLLVKAPDAGDWVPADSTDGQDIMSKVESTKCDSGTIQPCTPPNR